MKDLIINSFEKSAEIKRKFIEENAENLLKIGLLISDSLKKGRKLLIFGNGGSAADAQHIAAEIVGRYTERRLGLPAIALTTDTSILTALGNDFGFESIFELQIEALCKEGDIAMGISTSGNSENVIRGIRKAKEKGAITVGLTGISGGRLAEEADFVLKVPSDETPRIQECHITIGHVICEIIERSL